MMWVQLDLGQIDLSLIYIIYNLLIQRGQTVLKRNPLVTVLNWSSLTPLLNLVVTIRGDISFAVGADNTLNYLKPVD